MKNNTNLLTAEHGFQEIFQHKVGNNQKQEQGIMLMQMVL